MEGDDGMTQLPQFQMLSPLDIATHLGVSKMTVYRLIQSRELHAYRVGKGYRVRPDDFADYMRRADLEADLDARASA